MRYLARRTTTGEWIDRDLPLSNVERTRNLSGPGLITATIEPALRNAFHSDGLRVLEKWGTTIYACDETATGRIGQIRNVGIFVDATYEESGLTATCPGFATYPQGYIFDESRNWGPQKSANLGRPDPLQIVQDHWAWIQRQPKSDLGVRLVGDLSSTQRIGSYAEPYRLRWFEIPDLGREIDDLASSTPFDYVEEVGWANEARTEDDLRIRLGWPRLGTRRNDLRFVIGENVIETVPAAETGGGFANDVIGIGRGEGSKMIVSRATNDNDGRLRRTRVVTDKTATKRNLDRRTSMLLDRLDDTLDITSVSIVDHPNARIGAIEMGDEVLIQTYLDSYGEIEMWVRVLAVTESDDTGTAVLSTQRASAFIYSSTVEVSGT